MSRSVALARVGSAPAALRRLLTACVVGSLLLVTACGIDGGAGPSAPSPGARSADPSADPSAGRSADPSTEQTSAASPEPNAATSGATPSGTPAVTRKSTPQRPLRGIDVSHHQGSIDWRRVSEDGIGFAYLKATEGSSFTDPRFVANATGARQAGLRVGGYHYFTLCSPGAPQAEHFADVLASAPARGLPPAIDLELLGNCDDPPPREALLREVRAFMDVVERATGKRVVVYAYPELESRYRLSAALDRRLWVRRLGDAPPQGDWWMWQRSDSARVDGVSGGVDLNVLAR